MSFNIVLIIQDVLNNSTNHMSNFDNLYETLLAEFNVQDRNDPSFYDYVVIMLQQFKQRNLLPPEKLTDIRKVAMQIVKDGYYNFIDEANDLSFKINFVFDTDKKDVNSLQIRIMNLLNPSEAPKVIDNTHEESSVDVIGDYIETKKTEGMQQQGAGTEVPAAVGDQSESEMPGAVTPPSTSQYLKGL
jgi:hypothetical protein